VGVFIPGVLLKVMGYTGYYGDVLSFILAVENKDHCDFVLLRDMIVR